MNFHHSLYVHIIHKPTGLSNAEREPVIPVYEECINLSRSIHSTYRVFLNEQKNEYTDKEIKRIKLKNIYKDVKKKQSIKKQVLLERKFSPGKRPNKFITVDLESVPINLYDLSEYIHYPSSIEDLRGVLRRLPNDIVLGLDSITLCLGKEYQEKTAEKDKKEDSKIHRDPFTGRICGDDVPFYVPPVLGTYWTNTCKIFIYAFVYDEHEIQIKEVIPFLRLNMLGTFVHELAHHDDNMRRTGRGRWLGINEWKSEDYAELKEKEWAVEVVLPYLLETYPEEYMALSNWIEKNGGVNFPLHILAGERGEREIDGLIRIVFTATSAVTDLFRNCLKGISRYEAMIEFAHDIHNGDFYEECLISLNSILKEYPNDPKALGMKSDTYIHMEQFEKAQQVAELCLSIDPRNVDALDTLCDAYQRNRDWYELYSQSTKGMDASEELWRKNSFIETNVLALVHLTDFEKAKSVCDTLPEKGRFISIKRAYEALIQYLIGNYATAYDISKAMLSQIRVAIPAKAIMKTILNRASRYDYEQEKLNFSEYESNYLDRSRLNDLLM